MKRIGRGPSAFIVPVSKIPLPDFSLRSRTFIRPVPPATATSSRSSPPAVSTARARQRSAVSAAVRRSRLGQQLGDVVGGQRVLRRTRLGQPVGVEQEHVAGVETGAGIGDVRVVETPISVPEQSSGFDRPGARPAAPAAGARRRPARARSRHRRVRDAREDRGQELARARLGQHSAVERAQHRAGRVALVAAARIVWRASAVRAAASTPLPHTSPIASPQPPSASRERVVEVAADVESRGAARAAARRGPARGCRGSARGSSDAWSVCATVCSRS